VLTRLAVLFGAIVILGWLARRFWATDSSSVEAPEAPPKPSGASSATDWDADVDRDNP
jgi:hypothetical protein